MPVGRFYAGVGALIWSPRLARYLVLQRAAHRDAGAGLWECVTGRVDQGESFEQALHREVREELGVAVQVDFLLGSMHFYRGEPRPENELVGLVYHCTLDDPAAIQVSDEHSDHRWVTPHDVVEVIPEQAWIARAIRRADFIRQHLPEALIDFYHHQDFCLTPSAKPVKVS